MAHRTTATGSPTRRMFVAVAPPPEAITALDDQLAPHQVRWPDLRWTDPSGWHLTCCFMPRVDRTRLTDLAGTLGDLAAATAGFPLGLSGVGVFPAPGIAKSIWLGADDHTESMPPLAGRCRRAAGRTGIRTADEPFIAHLTLAKFSRPTDARHLLSVLDGLAVPAWGVHDLVLFESLRGQGEGGRPRYVVVERFPLARR